MGRDPADDHAPQWLGRPGGSLGLDLFGPTAESVKLFPDLDIREKWVVAPLIAVIIAVGFFPKPLLDVINPAVDKTLSTVQVDQFTPAVADKKGAGQ